MATLRPPTGRLRRARGSSAGTEGDDNLPSCSHADGVWSQSAGRLMKRRTHEEPQSDESYLSPYRSCDLQQQLQHQQQQQPGQIRDHQNGHQTVMKSAKRRAAEALLAARFGGGTLAALEPFPTHGLAAAALDVRQAFSGMSSRGVDGGASTIVACRCSALAGGRRHLCSSNVVPTDSQSTGTAIEGPEMPTTAAAASGPAAIQSLHAAHTVRLSDGLSLLQQQVELMAAAAAPGKGLKAAKAAAAAGMPTAAAAAAIAAAATSPAALHPLDAVNTTGISDGLSRLQHQAARMAVSAAEPAPGNHAKAAAAAAAVSRHPAAFLGPAPKRAQLSLSATAASSLGGGLSGASQTHQQHQGSGAAAAAAPTRVPPCDPARGCKAWLREAAETAAAAARRRRPGGQGPSLSAVELGGDGAEGAGVGGSSTAGADLAAGGAAPGPRASDPLWCSFEVTLPSVNWQAVFDEPPGALQRYSIARGYEKLLLPQGLVTYVVEHERHVGDALRHLKAGMQDRLVAIDLEWRPETVSGRVSPVALLQLSTARVCVVVRTSCMGYGLPAELASFLTDSAGGHVLLGFGWDSSDETKMRGTFGLGRADFGKFLDLQEIATSLGYHGFGLSRLSQQVLGLPPHKSKAVTRSNWAAPQLTNHQLKYASLDVLVAGQLYRALRLWHSSPSPCADCRTPIGELLLPGLLRCGHPGCTTRPVPNLPQHRDHCASTGHPARFAACGSCGRLYELQGSAETRKL